MIAVNILGGLGNQMFQYAFARSLARRKGYSLKLDLADFDWYRLHEGFHLKNLGVPYQRASDADLKGLLGWQHVPWARRLRLYKRLPRRQTIVEPSMSFSPACANAPDDSYLVGYWQSERYFADCADSIRRDFCSAPLDLAAYGALPAEIENSESVAVHVRRADYVSSWRNRARFAQCGDQYYRTAMETMRSLVHDPRFFVFSDDPSAIARENLIDGSHTLVDVRPRPPAHVEMRLMARCKHFIIANSSFSWWAAWLGSNPAKHVIAPRKWFASSTRDTRDLFPDGWTVVG